MANKYYALQKDVFDISKVTVVGSPTISDDGFISNCSGSNYAKINSPITSVNNKFQVDCTIPIGTGVPFVIYIGTTAKMFFWRTANNQLRVVLRSTTTDLLDTTVTVPETSLNVKCIVENNTCLVNVNGENLINNIITASVFFEMLLASTTMTFGSDIGNHPFNQPLDLKTFKIYVDGQLVYSPTKPTYLLERRKEGYDPSKFTIVGSPTVTEYGVLSNCSSNNIVQTPPINITNPNWEFNFVIDTNGMSGNVGVLGIPSIGFCYVNVNVTTEKCTIYLVQQWAGNGGVPIFNLPLKKYQVVWGMNGTTHYSKIKEFGATEWLKEVAKTYETVRTTSSAISIGRDTTNNLYLTNGSIDLPSFSITVDGKEVFTGAKVGYYVLRR